MYFKSYLKGHIKIQLNPRDFRLIRTVCFAPGKESPLAHIFSNSTRLIRTPINTDAFHGPLSVHINRV